MQVEAHHGTTLLHAGALEGHLHIYQGEGSHGGICGLAKERQQRLQGQVDLIMAPHPLIYMGQELHDFCPRLPMRRFQLVDHHGEQLCQDLHR